MTEAQRRLPAISAALFVLLAANCTNGGAGVSYERTARAREALEGLSAEAILEGLDRVRTFPGPKDFERTSVLNRVARGDLAADGILGFHSLSLDDEGSVGGGTRVDKIVYWVAHSVEDAKAFYEQELDSLDVRMLRRAPGRACSQPGGPDSRLDTCLALIDKVVLMSVAHGEAALVLDDGVALLADLPR